MLSDLSDYTVPIIFACLVVVFGCMGINSNYKNNNNYKEAICHNDDYTIYLDGKKQNEDEFNISSLDENKYSFEINDSKKEIYINKNNVKDNSSSILPIFLD